MTFGTTIARRLPGIALQTLFIVSLVVTAALLAWSSLRVVDFGYPWLYEKLSIEQHIEKWAPRNRFRQGLETTTRQERVAIFSAIVTAVHEGGDGLDAIRYRDGQGDTHLFLRTPERVHLQSVARLIDLLYSAAYLALGTLVVVAVALRRFKIPPPRLSRILLGTFLCTTVAILLVFAIGPAKLFYTAHHWVFPPGEQWYFTYRESLMTTLMKAPDLFGGIAVLLAAAWLLYFGLLFTAARVWLYPKPADAGEAKPDQISPRSRNLQLSRNR